MAAHETLRGQNGALHRPVAFVRVERVRGAGRVKLTNIAVQRADNRAPDLHEPDEWVPHTATIRSRTLCQADSKSASRSPLDAAGSALTTRSSGCGAAANLCATRCLSLRFTRLRTTAFPTDLGTTKPARDTGWEESDACRTRVRRATLTPRRSTIRNSVELRRRCCWGSTAASGPQPARRARPLLRRDAKIARPARVRMRRRKPWVRLRRRLLGWKVRLLTPFSHSTGFVTTAPTWTQASPSERLSNDTWQSRLRANRLTDER